MGLDLFIESHRDDMIRSTRELVAIPSVKGLPRAWKTFWQGTA